MISDNDKISNYQLNIFVILTIIEIGMAALPAILVKEVKSDAWILSIITGLVNIPFLYIVSKAAQKTSTQGFVGCLKSLFGKAAGTILAIPVLVYFLFMVGLESRLFGETVKMYFLQRTPIEFIVMPIIIEAVFLAKGGIEVIGRFFEAVFFPIVLINVLLILIAIPKNDFTNLLPVFSADIKEYFSAIIAGSNSFFGYELLLIISPYIKEPKKMFKTSTKALLIVTGFYTIAVILNLGKFGVEETKSLMFPVIALAKAIDVPGSIFERAEGILMAVWVLHVFTTMAMITYLYSVVGAEIIGHKGIKHIATLYIPVVYLFGLLGDNVAQVFKNINMVGATLGIYTVIILPLLILIASYIKNKGGSKG
mgnify:FL=1